MKPPRAADLAPLAAVLPEGCPDTWRELVECLYLELREPDAAQLPPEQLAWRQLQRVTAAMGGMNWYLQKGTVFFLSPRNRQMCSEFRGDYKILARKYDLTEQQVRNIVDRWQSEEFLKKQNPLFSADDAGTPAPGAHRKTRRAKIKP